MDVTAKCEQREGEQATNTGSGGILADDEGVEQLLGKYRPYLRALAENELPRELQAKLDASDLVQETLLRGFRDFGQYRGTTDRELTAWLTEILRNYLADVQRGLYRGVRDIRRERPLEDVPCGKSPMASDLVRQGESQERLEAALRQLSDAYRGVLELRQQELTFPEIGERLGRSADAARMLWGRAIVQLGKLLHRYDG